MAMWISEKFQNSKFYRTVGGFFRFDWYLLTLSVLMIIPFSFKKYFVALWMLTLLTCAAMVLCKDILPSFAGFLFASMSVFELHKISTEEIFSTMWIALPIVASFLFHMIFYRQRHYRPCKTFRSQIAVSIAITLAGLGATTAKEYFALPTLYFCVFLGFGLLGILVVLDMYVPEEPEYIQKYFAKIMMFVGFTVILMWMAAVFQDIPSRGEGFRIPYRQWKNNVGNLMLIAVPATLFYGTKSRHSWAFFIFAALELAAIMFSLSRGSMMVAAALAPFEIILFFIFVKDKKQRIICAAILGFICVCIMIFLFANDKKMWDKLINALHISEHDSRWKLYIIGLNNFRAHPWFGVGFGFRDEEVYPLNDMAIFWYHSTPVQIIASMGILGIVCYLYQLIVRLKLLFKRNAFNLFMIFSFAGFEGYSCVNTGDFSPIPFAILIVMIFIICEKSVKRTDIKIDGTYAKK